MIQDPLLLPTRLPLARNPGTGTAHYILDDVVKRAVRFAWARGRPLLVIGEAGCGKSQLAAALANEWQVPLYAQVIQSTTQANDLLWQMDAVQRLADAQLAAVTRADAASLAMQHYVRPGALWWAWDAQQAQEVNNASKLFTDPMLPAEPVATCATNGECVVLIDEIDKAALDVPNNLLEVLDAGSFTLPWSGTRIGRGDDQVVGRRGPLIVITSNGERDLPAAFLRRCIVLPMKVAEDTLVEWLVQRGRAHFPDPADMNDDVLTHAAVQIQSDRKHAGDMDYRPGVSEYIDLLHAVQGLTTDNGKRLELLGEFAPFVLKPQASSLR